MADKTLVETLSKRIHGFAGALGQAHQFGTAPGQIHDVWGTQFHHQALPLYQTVLPDWYLRRTGYIFAQGANIMAKTQAPEGTERDWNIISSYLWSMSEVIIETVGEHDGNEDDLDIEPRTPAVMPFNDLAALTTIEGATRLAAAAKNVATSLETGPMASNPLTDEEQQWLRQFSNGAKTIDVANQFGFSERHLYRLLNDVYTKLKADTRIAAVLIAETNGWL